MTPIRINLLPHREARRARQAQQFNILALGVLLLGGLAVFAGHLAVTGAIENQQRRNEFLRQEIARLDAQIKEVNLLKEKIQALMARKEIVENLQSRRTVPVHVLDELARQLPEGLRLKAIRQTGENALTIQGDAQASPLVSIYMRSLEESPWFENLALVEVKALTQGALRTNEFALTLTISDPNAKAETAKPGKGGQ